MNVHVHAPRGDGLGLQSLPSDPLDARVISLLAGGCFTEALEPLRLAFTLGDTRPATVLNLAIAEDRAGDRERAQRLMRIIVANLPGWDEPRLRLAESLRAQGDRGAAEQMYRDALRCNPDRVEALIALSGLLLLRGAAEEARDLLERCCGIAPRNGEAWNTLGLALRATGAPDLALSAFTTARECEPLNLGYAMHAVDAAFAIDCGTAELERLEIACRREGANPVLQAARGVALERLGRRVEAIQVLEAATFLSRDDLTIMRLLGSLLVRSSNAARAEAVLRCIAERDPESAQAKNDYAAALMRVHRHAEARALLLELLERDGAHMSVICNLANATACLGLQAEAVAVARRAIEAEPEAPLPRRALCNTLPYLHGVGGCELLDAMKACSDCLPRSPQPPLANSADPERRLHVGLLSGTLRSHPVGWLTVAGVEALDPAQFRITCLVQNAALQDPIARRFHSAAESWIEVDALSDAGLATVARASEIDILIDLGGYGDASRMIACANRLAPVQIKWVGMQAHSSGLAEMDWFLTDRWETPSGFEALYSERLLRLPDGYICYSPPPYAPDVGPLPALRNGRITFGCFNNLAKLTPELIETWVVILRRVPDARLVLKTHQLTDRAIAECLVSKFSIQGVDPARIETRGSSGHRAFLGEYNDIDIVLDPFPYSGGLTTCEALWMGVPTVTWPGEIFASRHSASHMSNAGLADWVAGSREDYIEMAVARAADLPALAALRADLREQVRLSPLCDAPRFGRNLGEALRDVWRDWCRTPS